MVGTYTDRAGRKAGLTLSIGLMMIGTTLMVITPGYATIGIAAPINGAVQHHGADGDRAACASCRKLMKGVRDPSSHRRVALPSSARELNPSCRDKPGSARNSAPINRCSNIAGLTSARNNQHRRFCVRQYLVGHTAKHNCG